MTVTSVRHDYDVAEPQANHLKLVFRTTRDAKLLFKTIIGSSAG
jgi:hypothetical protein